MWVWAWSIQVKGMRRYRQTSRRPTNRQLDRSISSELDFLLQLKSQNLSVINVCLRVVFSREGDEAIPTDLAQTHKMRLGLSIASVRPNAHFTKVGKLFSNKCRPACGLFKRRGCGHTDRPRADPQNAAWAFQSLLFAQMPILLKSENFSVINVWSAHGLFKRRGSGHTDRPRAD